MKRHLSIRSYILRTILIMVLLALTSVFGVSYYMVRASLESSRISEIKAELSRLSGYIVDNGMENAIAGDNLSQRTMDYAGIYSGRIMIVSRNYEIVLDTTGRSKGSYIINKQVMDVMTSIAEEKIYKDGNISTIVVPINRGDEVLGAIVATTSMEGIWGNIKTDYMFIAFFSILIFFICVIVSIHISKSAIRDLDDINEQMAHTTQGNLRNELSEQRFAETRLLAENYNEILSKLASIDQTRSEFVSNVSHELKTPITSMKVLAESITQNEGASVDDYKEFMTDIVDEIDRETKIINDLLTLVKTDSQGSELNLEEKNINEMMEPIVKTVTPLAKQRNIDLSYESYREVMADVDPVKLSLAISNLIENAVKYNIDNGWIRCSLNEDHKYFYIKVADSGVGIPEDAKDKVFERFYRVDKARSRDTGGTGLGLAITRSIINAHKGTIKLYSEAGKGTTFTIRIPMKQEKIKNRNADSSEKKKSGKQSSKNSKNSKKKAPKMLVSVFLLFTAALNLSGCAIAQQVSSSEATTEEVRPGAGSVQLYHATDDGVEKDEGFYQLKQPDNLTATIEELIEVMSIDEQISIERFSSDEAGNVSLFVTRGDEVTEECWLLNQAAIVRNLEELSVNDVIVVVVDANGNEISTATYTDASFYYFD